MPALTQAFSNLSLNNVVIADWIRFLLQYHSMLLRKMRKIYLLCCCLIPLQIWATTTSGGTIRFLTIDGIVNAGASPGNNGTDWETDEVFQGYNGDVNWYMSWDETNLYLGRIGGNNAEGSVIYVRAEYPGATYSNIAQNYDELMPDCTPMGGVNFAAYIKNSYDEYRVFNAGAWQAPNLGLNPMFSIQGPLHHFEVVIPWSAISNGNGSPSNIRVALYQVARPGGPLCIDEKIYGESPWGTGNIGDGPNIGVNDGAPISARQPGGCDVGDSVATRWWGCYPVIGGVGANGWIAVAPNAGPDDSICQTASAYVMQGNLPPGQALGTWTNIGRPAGAPPVNILNPNQNNTFIQNLTGFGTYTFVWNINYGGCPAVPDTVRITRLAPPPVAVVSGDTIMPCGGDSLVIFGNDPGNGTGVWTLFSGQGTIATPNDTSTLVYNLGPGINQFAYTISNGVCPVTSDVVTIRVPIPVVADAGPDVEDCFFSITQLQGNNPVLQQSTASGVWTQVSGPSNLILTNPFQYNTNASSFVPGTYTLVWTLSNIPCPTVRDTVQIVNYDAPIADAGSDQTYCFGDAVGLLGNDYATLGDSAQGFWTQLAGPSTGSLVDSLAFNTTLQNLQTGTYSYLWTVQNGNCPVSTDGVKVTILQLQDDGLQSIVLPDSAQSNGIVTVAIPQNGTAPFLFSIDGLNFTGSSVFDSLASGSYIVAIMDANGCSDTLQFELGYKPYIDPPIVVTPDSLTIPNGFTPNGDGVNDFWELPGIEAFPNANIEVFNIWGGRVFQSIGAYRAWNGQRNGQE